MNRLIFAIILALSIGIGIAAGAQPVPADNATGGDKACFAENLKKWRSMTPEQQARMRLLYDRWKAMPEAERQRIRENLARFHKMHEGRREAIVRAHKMLEGMHAGTREEIEKRLGEIQQMPPERRERIALRIMFFQETLKDEFEKLRALPPDSPEARQLMMQIHVKGRILRTIPQETFEKLQTMTPEDRQKAVGQYIEEHKTTIGPMPEGGGAPFGGHRPDGDGPRDFRRRHPHPDAPDNAT